MNCAEKFYYMRHIARGLRSLHSFPLVHGRVCGSNVLISFNGAFGVDGMLLLSRSTPPTPSLFSLIPSRHACLAFSHTSFSAPSTLQGDQAL